MITQVLIIIVGGKFCKDSLLPGGDGKCTLETNCSGYPGWSGVDDNNACDYDGGEVCCHACQATNSCGATGVFQKYEIFFFLQSK